MTEDVEKLDALADALAGALRAAVAESAIAEPFLLLVGAARNRLELPPTGWLAGAEWREHVRAGQRGERVTMDDLRDGVPRGLVQRLELGDRLDSESVGMCRATASQPARLGHVRTQLSLLLREHLDCFVAVDTGHGDDTLTHKLVAGTDVEAFRRAVA
ncbi:hypothetical protein OJ997_18745 [Solirubrobacter phytolaccae]|uniref:Uncharacterized protein n=1 Tax=Solirubrobacter phytolaccae TaxID=1404360 RepID=A0A9X3N9M0_9ACTN|nr:hypothetical protein [Solirubrobacter phytolaccae]MDA0182353.1 hypothetical protein [Solirubrobacter phytolaccae]